MTLTLATGVVMIGEIDGDHNRTRLQLRSTERSARLSTRRESLLRPNPRVDCRCSEIAFLTDANQSRHANQWRDKRICFQSEYQPWVSCRAKLLSSRVAPRGSVWRPHSSS